MLIRRCDFCHAIMDTDTVYFRLVIEPSDDDAYYRNVAIYRQAEICQLCAQELTKPIQSIIFTRNKKETQ